MTTYCKLLILMVGVFLSAMGGFAQTTYGADEADGGRLRLFLDCNSCDPNFVRQELTYIDHVRDPQLAQIHVFVTSQYTASGGRIFNLSFIGKDKFEGQNQTLTYTSLQTETFVERRQALLERLKIGLVPYLAQTPLADRMQVQITKIDTEAFVPEKDPWRNWIFDLYGSGSFRTESSRTRMSFSYGMEADHITEDWRIRIRPSFSYSENRFQNENETIVSLRKSSYLSGVVVKSVNSNWSAGLFSSISSATYSNIQMGVWVAPAVEYSFLPYSEAMRKELTISYQAGYIHRNYYEPTIYDKLEEQLWRQSLKMNVRIRQPWGHLFAGVEGSTFLHDMSKNRLEIDGNLSYRVFKGLSVRISGDVEFINDQISLPKGDASLTDILLQQRQLATDYEMSWSIGLNYTFGSIYNNVVNTRL